MKSKLASMSLILFAVILISGCQSTIPETPTSSLPEKATDSPIPLSTRQIGLCPITPPQSDFWNSGGPVAGEFPIWISSRGQAIFSQLGPKVLPPSSGTPQFEDGRITKALVFVDKSVQGDLTITGHQLDGNSLVYFPKDDETKRLNETTLQLLGTPADSLIIPDANQTNKLPEPEGQSRAGHVTPIYNNWML